MTTPPDLPDSIGFEAETVTNREWLWIEDSCGVNAAKAQEKPMRLVFAFKTLALRRWEAQQGRPPKITFGDVLDGKYDDVDFNLKDDDEEAEGDGDESGNDEPPQAG